MTGFTRGFPADDVPEGQAIECPECGADMALRESKYGPFYGCTRYPACDCTHGAHADGRPLGVPANKATRRARMNAHDAFDALWKGKDATMSRGEAYAWLSKQSVPDHIAEMAEEECDALVLLIEEEFGV